MQVFPEAATLGAPSWVTVGTQAAWYTSGATVAQSRYQWVEDPNGTWEDPATGKKYRRTDESGEGTGSGAGDGYSILDVVALEGTQAVGSWVLYSIDRLAGSYTVAPDRRRAGARRGGGRRLDAPGPAREAGRRPASPASRCCAARTRWTVGRTTP